MKIRCSKENLTSAVSTVSKAVSSKSSMQILEGILVEADEGINFTGNDLEVGIKYYMEGEIDEKGSIVVNARIFGEISRKLPDEYITIETDKANRIKIETKSTKMDITGVSAEGYPQVPEISKEESISIIQKDFKDMIRQTIFCVGDDEYKPVFTGILLEVDSEGTKMVALDGTRMAYRKYSEKCEKDGFKVIIPGKAMNELSKILNDDDQKIIIWKSRNQVLFEIENKKLTTRLIEGEFLNYKSLLMKESENHIRINVINLQQSLERAALLSVGDRKYPVDLTIADDMLLIDCNSDIGDVHDEIKITAKQDMKRISFNPNYMIDALKVIEEDEVIIAFVTSAGPCIIRPVEGERYTYLIAALRREYAD